MSDEIITNETSSEEVKAKGKSKGKRKTKISSKKKVTKNPVTKFPISCLKNERKGRLFF